MPERRIPWERNDINWGSLRDNVDVDDDLMHLFGNEYTFDGEVSQQLPAGGALRVNCDRGNITVTDWDQPQVKVVYHKRIFAGSQGEADSTNRVTAPQHPGAGHDRGRAGQHGGRRAEGSRLRH